MKNWETKIFRFKENNALSSLSLNQDTFQTLFHKLSQEKLTICNKESKFSRIH